MECTPITGEDHASGSAQLRALLAVAALSLILELRLQARGTTMARAQVVTTWLNLIKLGVRLESSVPRTADRLPSNISSTVQP